MLLQYYRKNTAIAKIVIIGILLKSKNDYSQIFDYDSQTANLKLKLK